MIPRMKCKNISKFNKTQGGGFNTTKPVKLISDY